VSIEIHPVSSDRWDDLVALFGPTGQQGGCWCMWNRQSSREFEECKGEANQKALRRLVADGTVPGLLAYDHGLPVGWVSLGPREVFSRLQRSRVTKPVDDLPVWAITCFVINRKYRHQGVATRLLEAAIEYARTQGAVAVEGYPVEPRKDEMPAIYAWMGLASMFRNAGFEELARRSEHRPVMRLTL
jgi:GNAT superfamily N-acetyltransferase